MALRTGETAERILAAALKVVAKRGLGALTMEGVADAAGVTRQTVYFYFGTRTKLMSDMMRVRMREHPLMTEVRRLGAITPVTIESFEAYIAAALRFAASVMPEGFIEWGHVANDKAALKGLRALTDGSVASNARLIADLKRQGLLQPGWTVEDAAEWVTLQLYPGNIYAMTTVRGWTVERVIDRTLLTLQRSLLTC
jgi:AcrR family transcriptional regulator